MADNNRLKQYKQMIRYIKNNKTVRISLPKRYSKSDTDLIIKYINEFLKKHKNEDNKKIFKLVLSKLRVFKNKWFNFMVKLAMNGVISIFALEKIIQAWPGEQLKPKDTGIKTGKLDLHILKTGNLYQLLTNIIESPLLITFIKHYPMPEELKYSISLPLILSELNTFPDFKRYNLVIKVDKESTAFEMECLFNTALTFYILDLLNKQIPKPPESKQELFNYLIDTLNEAYLNVQVNPDFSSYSTFVPERQISLMN